MADSIKFLGATRELTKVEASLSEDIKTCGIVFGRRIGSDEEFEIAVFHSVNPDTREIVEVIPGVFSDKEQRDIVLNMAQKAMAESELECVVLFFKRLKPFYRMVPPERSSEVKRRHLTLVKG